MVVRVFDPGCLYKLFDANSGTVQVFPALKPSRISSFKAVASQTSLGIVPDRQLLAATNLSRPGLSENNFSGRVPRSELPLMSNAITFRKGKKSRDVLQKLLFAIDKFESFPSDDNHKGGTPVKRLLEISIEDNDKIEILRVGREPSNLLEESRRSFKAVSSKISVGIVPDKLLDDRSRKVRSLNFRIADDKVPSILLKENWRYCMAVSSKTSVGIVPDKLLKDAKSPASFLSFPIADGKVPSNLFE
jgi:hypothetical protein